MKVRCKTAAFPTSLIYGKEYDKGVAFSSRLGYSIKNWEEMQREILKAAVKYPATRRGKNAQGPLYSQNVILQGKKGKPANVTLGWIVHDDGTLHLVTAYMGEMR